MLSNELYIYIYIYIYISSRYAEVERFGTQNGSMRHMMCMCMCMYVCFHNMPGAGRYVLCSTSVCMYVCSRHLPVTWCIISDVKNSRNTTRQFQMHNTNHDHGRHALNKHRSGSTNMRIYTREHSDITGYTVQMEAVAESGAEPPLFTDVGVDATETKCNIACLVMGKLYRFKVRGVNEAGAGIWSEPVEYTPQAGVPTMVSSSCVCVCVCCV